MLFIERSFALEYLLFNYETKLFLAEEGEFRISFLTESIPMKLHSSLNAISATASCH